VPTGATDPGPGSIAAKAEADQKWQAALWRRIIQEVGTTRRHPAAVFFDSLEAMGPDAASKLNWPKRVHIFCLPAMAPQYIDILRHLGKWIDLQLYVLNPCREYWFEIADARRLSYLAAKGDTGYHESGNRLLAAWGKQSQSHLDLLFGDSIQSGDEDSLFVANADLSGGDSLLAQVQDAILDMADPAAASISMQEEDRSIEVHVCHSLTRELEVLQDQLLALFAGEHPPLPGDILVATPDLEQAAPLIEAVFGNVPPQRRIPYIITGRGRSKLNPVARALLDLLAVVSSRFSAVTVFNLLRQSVVAHRFCLTDDLDAIHDWIAESGIRWGLDGAHKEQFGLPGNDSHSFEDGLQRLFMGYALPNSARTAPEPFNQRLPAGNPEGKSAAALGCFWHFMQQLQGLRKTLAQPMSADEWMPVLFGIIDTFMKPVDDQLDDEEEVRDHIRKLHENMLHGCDAHPVGLDVMLTALTALFDDPARGGVPTGAVTFSSMSSLRNLPYRILCAIGLNDGSFPSADRPDEFDLLALAPRRGDRQRRYDERNLFLDLLLAARERLYLSYTGRSVRDNTVLPASVLVSELLDYVAPAIASDASAASVAAARRRLVVEHPLQPFSTSYFDGSADPRMVSSNDEFCDALMHKQFAGMAAPFLPVDVADIGESDEEAEEESEAEAGRLFFDTPLPQPGEEWREVGLDQLVRFFRNPCRFLLKYRMGIAFADEHEELLQDEPFFPDRRQKRELADRLLPLYLAGRAKGDIHACALAGIEFPCGSIGSLLLDQEMKSIGAFARNLAPDVAAPILPPHSLSVEFDLDGQKWRLGGSFSDLRPAGRVRHRYDNANAGDYLSGWIEHLFLNTAAAPAKAATQTIWHSRNGHYRYPELPCGDAIEHLRRLLEMYRSGLTRPLHFFPRTAWAYMANEESMGKAATAWKSKLHENWGEGSDPSYRLALRGIKNPLDASFIECSKTVFDPLLRHIEDGRLS